MAVQNDGSEFIELTVGRHFADYDIRHAANKTANGNRFLLAN